MTEYKGQVNGYFLDRLSCGFSSLAAGLGLLALVGWIVSIHWLSSFWPGGIPMAPSTALLFLCFGSVLPLRTRSLNIFRHSLTAALLVWVGTGISVMLLILSLNGVFLPIEYLGMDISGMMDGTPIGHMSPMAALIFSITGCSFLFLSPLHRKSNHFSFWLAAIIVLVSMILIVGYLVDAPLFYGTAIIPPAMATSLAFFFLGIALLLSAGLSAWPPRQTVHDGSRNGASIILLLVFILLAAGILGAGYLYSQKQQKQFRNRIENELSTIADLKIRGLKEWREERRADALIFFKNAAFSEIVRQFLSRPGDMETKRNVEIWLEKVQQMPQYDRISLLNTTGLELLSTPIRSGEIIPEKNQDINEAVEGRQVVFLDLARKSPELPPHLAIVVPIFAAPDWNEVLAVLTVEIDPEEYLYPLIQNWPTPSESAETLLVRRDGDGVLFLNNLRFKKDAALNLRLPLTQTDLPAVMAVQGKVGIVEGVDYRNKRGIAALRPVADSPWFLVTRMDLDEITQPLRERLLGMAGLLCTLLLGSGALVGLIWRNQRAHFYRLQYDSAMAVEESEKRLRVIFEGSKDGILVADVKTKAFMIANAAICRMLGYRHDELLTMRVSDIHPVADFPAIVEHFEQLVRGETPPVVNIPMLCRDGSTFYADINATPIQLGGQACMLGTFRDITDRMQAEARIVHLNRVLRAIRDVNQLIVMATSVEELIQNACTVLAGHQSYTSALIVLTDAGDLPLAHAEAGECVDFRPLIEQMEKGVLPPCCTAAKNQEGVFLMRGKDTFCETCPVASVCVSSQKMSIRLAHQNTAYGYLAVSVDMDITMDDEEEKLFVELAGDLAYSLHNMEVKREMRRTEDENKKLEAQFIQVQKMEAVGQLAGGVAHDFNNMLSVILGYAQMALEKTDPASSLHEDLQEIHDAGVRSANITRQLLAFARKQTIAPQVLDLNETVEDMLKMLRRLIGEDINLTWQPGSVWSVKIDPSQLDQLLANICVNARDAISGVGKIIIETESTTVDAAYCLENSGFIPGEFVLLSVSDDGCGMDKEVLGKVFEPFFTTKEMGKGTGLGLATVYGIVKQNNGFINVYSEPGKGTTFRIYLPRHSEQGSIAEKQSKDAIRRGWGETVFVVEDELAILKLTARMLEDLGYTVITANRPAKAVDLAKEYRERRETIDLLITDVVMPEMNGRDLADQFLTIYPDLKCLFMSGYTASVIASQGVLEADVHFIQKPFLVADLAAKVRKALDSQTRTRGTLQ